jgi:hypothetical protein
VEGGYRYGGYGYGSYGYETRTSGRGFDKKAQAGETPVGDERETPVVEEEGTAGNAVDGEVAEQQVADHATDQVSPEVVAGDAAPPNEPAPLTAPRSEPNDGNGSLPQTQTPSKGGKARGVESALDRIARVMEQTGER